MTSKPGNGERPGIWSVADNCTASREAIRPILHISCYCMYCMYCMYGTESYGGGKPWACCDNGPSAPAACEGSAAAGTRDGQKQPPPPPEQQQHPAAGKGRRTHSERASVLGVCSRQSRLLSKLKFPVSHTTRTDYNPGGMRITF